MFRGEEDVVETYVDTAYLCVNKGESMYVASIAKQDPEVDDARVLLFPEWKNHVPLPVTSLGLVIVTKQHLDPTSVKFGADVVPMNSSLRAWRCTLKKTGTTFSFRPTLQSIEGALDILTGIKEDVLFERCRSKETWQSICLGSKSYTIPNRIPL
jgi:hypothetical protein